MPRPRPDPAHRARLERANALFTPRAELVTRAAAACAERGHPRRRVVLAEGAPPRTVCEGCGADLGAVT